MKPVWLLDIDGVINAVARNPNTNIWPWDSWHRRTINGLKILAAEPVLDFIRHTHESGRAEIRWLTTWQLDAQLIADAFDLPTFPVEGGEEYQRALKERVFDHEHWWKRPAAWRVLVEEKRSLVWTDDDIVACLTRRGRDEFTHLGPAALLINPDPYTGLTRKDLLRIDEFLDVMADEEASVPLSGIACLPPRGELRLPSPTRGR